MVSLPLFVVAALELWAAARLPWWLGWAFGWAGLSTGAVAFAYLFSRPGWLGKERAFRWLLLPFLVFARGVAAAAQRLGLTERVEVVPGLWVGAWPRRGAPGLAQLDLTAELPRRGDAAVYHNVPMLDGATPNRPDYDRAVAKALEWRRAGTPVLVHCAYGHGRSVAVVVAVLLHEGHAATPADALRIVQRVRPRARMTPGQRAFVERVFRG